MTPTKPIEELPRAANILPGLVLLAAASLIFADGPALAGTAGQVGALQPSKDTKQNASPATDDPALRGGGEPPAGRDVAAAFSPASAAAPMAGQSRISAWQQTNSIGRAIRKLNQDGLALTANYVGNFAANPVGGVSQGSTESHWVDVAAELNLSKLLGLQDTLIHIQGADFHGHNLAAEHVGNSISFQQTWRPVDGLRLTQLNIEHDFGRLNVMAGRAALNSYFGASPLNCVFMSNTACLTGYGPIPAIGITAFPNSSWAAKARYAVSKTGYAQIGVFDYNNDLNLAGKGGLDFSFFQGTGVLIAAEAGYETSAASDRLPRRYRLGIDVNTDAGTSPLYDRNGQQSGTSGLPRAAQSGTRIGLYGVADQTIVRFDTKSKRNLALFGRFFLNVGQPTNISWFVSGGFVQTGTFVGRDNDTVGFLISDTHFGGLQTEYLRELRARSGGSGAPGTDEIVGEINYGFAAIPGFRLLPNVQYVLNPDPINATRYPRDIPDAIVIGLRVDVRLAQLFTGGS